jgi:hypothetical protein
VPTRSVLYLCESNGARILAFGSGISQVGTDYQVDFRTWEAIPSGEMGDNLFRSIDVALNVGGSWSLGITPIVDGVEGTEQLFSGTGAGEVQCEAIIVTRGARIAARVRSISRAGAFEIENVSYDFVSIRAFP